jgi:hypothetical protein
LKTTNIDQYAIKQAQYGKSIYTGLYDRRIHRRPYPAENQPLEFGAFNVVNGRKSFSGWNIGGIAETQEVIDFCVEHGITADIELIKVDQIDEASERLEKGDVKYRFVIDIAGSRNKTNKLYDKRINSGSRWTGRKACDQ